MGCDGTELAEFRIKNFRAGVGHSCVEDILHVHLLLRVCDYHRFFLYTLFCLAIGGSFVQLMIYVYTVFEPCSPLCLFRGFFPGGRWGCRMGLLDDWDACCVGWD